LFVGGFGFLLEEDFCGEDYATQAESALGGACVDEGLLERVRLFRISQAFERGDLAIFDGADWGDAGTLYFSVDENGAGSALREAATEFGSAEMEFVGEDVEQGSFWVDVY
jgi:hypothetical protein